MTRIAPRTYQDDRGRYWARFPVHGRYTWRLLRDAKTKRKAIAAAQSATTTRADDFAALAALYQAAGCPNRHFEKRPDTFVNAEKARLVNLVKWFGSFTPDAIRLPLLPQYAAWRLRQPRRHGSGERTVDKDLNTLSNVLQYGIAINVIEQNWIRANRPRYRKSEDVNHSRTRMPASAAVIHRLSNYFFDANMRSEVFAWMNFFAMFTGCRCSELRRLRLDAPAGEAGHIANGYLHLGRRSKSGVNPYCEIGPEFSQMIACFNRWHKDRFPKFKPYFPGPFGTVVDAGSHGHALTRACAVLKLDPITPHGFRAYYVTKRRRDGILDSHIAAEIGDKTVALISQTYGDEPGGEKLTWTPAEGLPAWLRWQPEHSKIARIA